MPLIGDHKIKSFNCAWAEGARSWAILIDAPYEIDCTCASATRPNVVTARNASRAHGDCAVTDANRCLGKSSVKNSPVSHKCACSQHGRGHNSSAADASRKVPAVRTGDCGIAKS